MENMTKELDELLQIYLPDEYYEDIRKNLIPALTRWKASGSVAAPTWYTGNEMYHWLIRNNYHENIARELSSKWAADLQGAFNKGFEKGTREIKEREEALKELLSLAVRYKNTVNFTTREDEFDRTQAIIDKARKLI